MTSLDPVRAITAPLSRTIAANGALLDSLAKAVQAPLGAAVRESGPLGQTLKDFLHGVWLGHSLHPALTDIPLGAWTAGVVFDLIGLEDAADASFALGSLAAVPTALAGTADWLEITDEQRRIGFVHGLLNAAALGLVVGSLGARARGGAGWGWVCRPSARRWPRSRAGWAASWCMCSAPGSATLLSSRPLRIFKSRLPRRT